ncbi:efflux RND transporter periplasmic adaptor subunit [Porticoccaceae bacterium LTM1]|nr:efflux RND transporter periplasmic adaptor subunit [Porticoccaceae bacterium LTM1]
MTIQKRIWASAIALIILITGFTVNAQQPKQSEQHAEHTHWVCPMECQPAVHEKGDCEICGMHLVEDKEFAKSEEHSHWVCPMDCQPAQHEKGDCQVCGMHLKEEKSASNAEPKKETHWVCPMGCQDPQAEPGRCDVCGMHLKEEAKSDANAEPKKETHWVCPMGCQDPQAEPGRCDVCGMHLKEEAKSDANAEPKKATHWVCPMGCQDPQAEPGRCDVCGMYLKEEPVEGGEHSGHNHQHQAEHKAEMPAPAPEAEKGSPQWVCPMHPQIVKDKQSGCPICGMDLVEKKPKPAAPAEKVIDYWTCPMHPQIKKDSEGSCPICGMDLVPEYKPTAGAEEGGVYISPAVENNLGVKTAEVEESSLTQWVDTVGYVQFNEDTLNHIHTRVEGWIEVLNIDSVGDPVKAGQVLFEIFSPELVNAQEEYVTALESGNKPLISASRQRLSLLGVSGSQIDALRKTRKVQQRLAVMADHTGYISMLNVREGMFVKPATEILATGELDTVWVIAEVFERQAAWLKPGQSVTMKADSYPGSEWRGLVEYIYPVLNPQSRTLEVRIQFENPDERLKPNMFANIRIHAGDESARLHIPRSALIRGGRYDRVVKSLGDGHYKSVLVTAGLESGDRVEILKGLSSGDKVVTSAQFMIDSESNLDAEMERMETHDHSQSHQH